MLKERPTEPTPEQRTHARFDLADIVDRDAGKLLVIGKAYRRTPMIEILWSAGVLSREQFKALAHYRHHADLADRSPVRDSLDRQRGGSGSPTVNLLNAIRVRDDCERAAGSLVTILRAIVVDDMSLSQWAIHRHGSVEKRRSRGTRIEPRPGMLELARHELRVASDRVMAELDAGPLDKAA